MSGREKPNSFRDIAQTKSKLNSNVFALTLQKLSEIPLQIQLSQFDLLAIIQ